MEYSPPRSTMMNSEGRRSFPTDFAVRQDVSRLPSTAYSPTLLLPSNEDTDTGLLRAKLTRTGVGLGVNVAVGVRVAVLVGVNVAVLVGV